MPLPPCEFDDEDEVEDGEDDADVGAVNWNGRLNGGGNDVVVGLCVVVEVDGAAAVKRFAKSLVRKGLS